MQLTTEPVIRMNSLPPIQSMPLAALLITVLALQLSAAACGELPVVEHPVEPGGPLRLMVVGDWGRKGRYNQSRVAEQVPCVPIF